MNQRCCIFIVCMVLFVLKITAQNFVIDTSDNRIRYYKSLINNNKTIVHFIEMTLLQQGIPKSLRNLAIIESGLNNNSLSWAKAAGVWQFIPSAAAVYGMNVSIKNDDRYNLYKSTYAAAKYLGDLFKVYHDWRLVVAAYNCGKGNVNKAIKIAGSNNYNLLCRHLPDETKEHVNKFILACYATNELEVLQTSSLVLSAPDKLQTAIKYKEQVTQTVISGGYKIIVIAQYLQIPVEKIEILNPDVESDLAKNGFANLVLPVDKMPDFLLQKLAILDLSLN